MTSITRYFGCLGLVAFVAGVGLLLPYLQRDPGVTGLVLALAAAAFGLSRYLAQARRPAGKHFPERPLDLRAGAKAAYKGRPVRLVEPRLSARTLRK